ncbi:Sec-independent protein translocase protein TatB [Pantoea sp. FN0302]|uniref:Sec-independent protein translocase protein TatB n=1 Tax=unclassified Pantoea TaxID=2630326 RepID=UPI003CF9BA8D
MFDIGFSELVLVFVIGLVVLGPQRLPVAVKTVVGWIRAMRSLAANVQNELAQELKLQELQDSLKKVEQASKNTLSPELHESMEELRKSADSMRRSYLGENEQADDEAHTIHNPLITRPQDEHTGVTPATADHQASAPEQKPIAGSADALSTPKPVVDAPSAGNAAASAPSSPAGQATAPSAAPSSGVSPETSAASSSQPIMNDKHGR